MEPDYSVVVEGATISSSDYATVAIKRRTYPTSVDFTVDHTEGKDVTYSEDQDAYYVMSDDLRLILTAFITPSEVTGTIYSEVWEISDSIASLCRVESQDGTTLELYIEEAGANLLSGTITHTKTYVDGTVKSRTVNFNFKSPVVALTTRHNSYLQSAMFDQGYASHSTYTYDVEMWLVEDLSFVLGAGSGLLHLGELNTFMNLAMTVLDLSNCTDLGNNPDLVDLEDNTQDYINILPRKSQTLAFDFEEIDMSSTHLAGVNLKEGSVLETITYSDYTEEVVLVNQSALTEVNIPEAALDTLIDLVIEGCTNLEEITWIEEE
jgi:hypothetical protein